MLRRKISLNIFQHILIFLVFSVSSVCFADDKKADWNDNQISWYSYDQGMRLAQKKKKPIFLIFYADWCPYCHKYSKLFKNRKIVEASNRFIMIRVNTDEYPSLSRSYNLDGGYIPRTFALYSNGSIIDDIYKPKRHKYSIGYKSHKILAFMQAALKKM